MDSPNSQLRQKPMTICIAAISKDGDDECIVLATDHMVSLGEDIQFEHNIKKYKRINKTTIALLSGQFLMFDDLIKLSDENLCYSNIAEEILQNFKNIRKERIKNEILDRAQIDRDFLLSRLSESETSQIMGALFKQIYEYSLSTTIILAGFEGSKAVIGEISEDGIEHTRDMFFTTIGIGDIEAHNTLLYQKHNIIDPVRKTIYNVFKAKKHTEHLPGIGKDTEILILKRDGLTEFTDLEILEKLFKKENDFGKNHEDLNKIKINRSQEVNDVKK
ncbi:MAG TPA: hypothetical protein VMV56_08955 [Williamwhitmania sp.]|nr:hypothetical protein [Williamwhitmania sp.]